MIDSLIGGYAAARRHLSEYHGPNRPWARRETCRLILTSSKAANEAAEQGQAF